MMKFIKFGYNQSANIASKVISSNTGILLSKPARIAIELNKKCNAKCIMCNCWKETKDYLNYKEILKLISDLESWIGTGFFLQLAGGEPLIFKGIYDILSFCADKAIVVKISTNGLALSENVCNKIIASKLRFLSVSLDSHLPAIHDKYRGVNGIFEKAVKGIKYLAENGQLTLGISSIIMKENISHFPESVEYFLSLPIDRFLFQPVGVWTESLPIQEWKNYEHWVNNEDDLDRTVTYLLEKKKEDGRIFNTIEDILNIKRYFTNPSFNIQEGKRKRCDTGFDSILIDWQGRVLSCGKFPLLGNIKDSSIKDIWYSKQAKRIRSQMQKCTFPCTYNCHKRISLSNYASKALKLYKSGLFK